ncbi:PQ-loop domain-containing transporter [Mycoplasma marinum]|uniref:PQ-loop repeat-containing protein n=1 Tax=Mycoplasma marinum TaxID=1937190 RepID=A0A4R0XLS2_9MOLU|nr:PQ-loop domain-containing transporter [Mycoplasma marinum]TCG11434.1 hypothetical protein C4B24_02065 [Mycoplasma marinum]
MFEFVTTLGWIAAILTILLGLPQLYYTVKTKKISGVNFLSMFAFWLGLTLWVFYAGLIGNPGLPVGIANIFALTTFSLVIIFLLKYSNNKYRLSITILISLVWALAIIFFAIMQGKGITRNNTGMLIFSALGGSLTTFAFLPQIIKTLKSKDTTGLSILLFILGTTVNISWTIYWGTFHHTINSSFTISTQLLPTILSFIGAIIWGTQLCLIIINKRRNKSKSQ